MTSVHCTAAAMAKAAFADTSRASASVRARATAYCSTPAPNASRSTSASTMPSVIAITVSSTRTGRASRTKPSAVIATIAAMRGWSWPSTKNAKAYAATAVTVICRMAGTESRSRTTRPRDARRVRPATLTCGRRAWAVVGTSTAAPASAGTISTCAAATSMPWLSTMSGRSAGTARFTTASATGPSSWCIALDVTWPTSRRSGASPSAGSGRTFSPTTTSPGAGSTVSLPSRCSSTSRRGGRPRFSTFATVSWPL